MFESYILKIILLKTKIIMTFFFIKFKLNKEKIMQKVTLKNQF